MAWLVGIDEAGYGPNLGPFVMAAVACRVPEERHPCCLWQLLAEAVRRPKMPDDGRLLIEDSKVVYSSTRGLRALERGVLATLARSELTTLAQLVQTVAAEALPELQQEAWFTGTTSLPLELKSPELELPTHLFQRACAATGASWGAACGFIVCPPRFNALLERWGSKSIVLAVGMAELIRRLWHLSGTDAIHIVIDKQGGRNTYTELLQKAIPQGTVTATVEGAERSTYEVIGAGRPVHIHFEPRADAGHFTVALASMLAKYLRELCMHEFNLFWRQHVTDLKPTAGYPGDAGRFLEAIRPAAARLNICEEALWRRK